MIDKVLNWLITRVEKLITADGGVPVTADSDLAVSWAAKYYLEAKRDW